jgi:hypothetical protein
MLLCGGIAAFKNPRRVGLEAHKVCEYISPICTCTVSISAPEGNDDASALLIAPDDSLRVGRVHFYKAHRLA